MQIQINTLIGASHSAFLITKIDETKGTIQNSRYVLSWEHWNRGSDQCSVHLH